MTMQNQPEKPYYCTECKYFFEFDDIQHTYGTLIESGLLTTKQIEYAICIFCYDARYEEHLMKHKEEIKTVTAEVLNKMAPHEFLKE